MPLISVITPCYNQGAFIQETIDSVLSQTLQDYEHIIINDGSTDIHTNKLLSSIDHPRIRVIHTTNQGLAAARNTGIQEAEGELIFPLDADDKISSSYFEKAYEIFKKNNDVGVVYCNAEFFDKKRGKWKLPEFSLQRILLNNIIYASAFYYRKDWERVGGYSLNMKYGWEDWDFWLKMVALDRGFYRISDVHFHYRVKSKSMSQSMKHEHRVAMRSQIMKNHWSLYEKNIYLLSENIEQLNKGVFQKIAEGGLPYLITALKNVRGR